MSGLARASVLAALFAACCGGAASAQAPSPAPSPSPSPSAIPRIGGVVTSDRRAEPLTSVTRPTFVVDRSTIESFGARTVGDALAGVPGVDLFSYGPFGATTTYGIRGSSAEQTLILQDGIPIIAGTTGTVDLGELSTIGLQRIEVVESGASTLYGTNATGGVINLVSETAAQPYARVSDGTYGDRDAALSFGSGGFAVSYERHVASNVFDYPAFAYAPSASGPNATSAGTRTNADAEQTALRLSYHADLGGGWTARVIGVNNATRIGVPGSLVFPTADARQGTALQSAQLDLTHAAGTGALTLTLAGSAQKLAYFYGPGAGEDDTYDGRAQASLRYTQSSARSDLVTGIDLSRESGAFSFAPTDPFTTPAGAAQSQSALYAQYGYDPSSATRVTLGLRGENDAPHGGVVAPSLGTRVDLGAARLTANVGESFRVPTLDELYYPGYANPALAPERLTDYDATLTFPNVLGGFSLGYFGRDGSNLIVTDPTTFVPFNASRASVNGMQATLATRPFHHLRAQLGVTDVYRALDTTTGLRLPKTPPIVATLGLDRPFDGGRFAFGARVRVVGSNADIPNYGPPPNYAALPPLADPYDAYTVADMYVRYRVAREAIATIRVRNLGNELYAPIYGYPAPGRTVEFEISTR
jgi:vitamin B12 transporter